MSTQQVSLSIVCVYNDPAVREQCLDQSIALLRDDTPDVEYLPVDNTNGTYPSAGAALNHGVSLARNDFVAFVHQDVFLHSLTALKDAAAAMQAGGFGLLGAVGIQPDGRIAGRIRDRVVLLGEPVVQPAAVDSVDEVLFLAPRSQLLREPLTESGDMAWHAYAVEYGLRVRKLGLRTGVADIPLTHNSLSTNVDRLDVAHQAVAAGYPDLLPVRTTCGVISVKAPGRVWLPAHRWRYRWLRESLTIQRAHPAAPSGTSLTSAVLADIRQDVDCVISRSPGRRLDIVNVCADGFADSSPEPEPLQLARGDGTITVAARSMTDVRPALAGFESGSRLLLTNLSRADLTALVPRLPAAPRVLGFHTGIGFWLLLGAPGAELPPEWRAQRATPLGQRPLTRLTG
jgi:Glycosyltransferase like family